MRVAVRSDFGLPVPLVIKYLTTLQQYEPKFLIGRRYAFGRNTYKTRTCNRRRPRRSSGAPEDKWRAIGRKSNSPWTSDRRGTFVRDSWGASRAQRDFRDRDLVTEPTRFVVEVYACRGL